MFLYFIYYFFYQFLYNNQYLIFKKKICYNNNIKNIFSIFLIYNKLILTKKSKYIF